MSAKKPLSAYMERVLWCNSCEEKACTNCANRITKEDRKKQFRSIMANALGWAEATALEKQIDRYGFFEVPGSIKYHGNYEGGLFDHSVCVTECLLRLTDNLNLEWEKDRSPYIVGMLHDMCKTRLYEKTESEWGYTKEHVLPGHGEKSVIMILMMLNLTEEEMLCIRWHMGSFDDEKNWKYYTTAVQDYPNVLWTHTADMEAAHIIGV